MQAEEAKQEVILGNICNKYRKTLLIDLATDTFQIGNLAQDEREALAGQNITKTSEYWSWFCNSEFVHDSCRQACLEFKLKPNSELMYTRKIGDDWHVMLLEITPLDSFGPDDQRCTLLVRDIDAIYKREYEAVVDRIGTQDSMTGLYNKLALQRDMEKHKDEAAGVIFADLNGLKLENDTKGHKAGDELILKFSGLLSINFGSYKCYHISGDEFVVIAFSKNLREFLKSAIAFHRSMWVAMDHPIASVGYSVGEAGELQLAYDEAEREMYDDKRIFYSRFPEYKRK